MPRSVSSLMNSGAISTKAYNSTLAKTRAQKSKMAAFHDKHKTDEKVPTSGKLKAGEIDQHEHQKRGTPGGKPSRGGMVGGGHPSVGANHINKQSNKRMFPAQGNTAPGKGGIPKAPAAIKGTVIQPGPYYGGSGRKG